MLEFPVVVKVEEVPVEVKAVLAKVEYVVVDTEKPNDPVLHER
jgi:hypothetical protein